MDSSSTRTQTTPYSPNSIVGNAMPDTSNNLPHVERVQFVVGEQDAGKSTELRSMFVDPRFGTKGVVPTEKRLKLVTLSRERCLFIRLTSPHERKETIGDFFGTIARARKRAARFGFRRFNVSCALQPFAANLMPDLLEVCSEVRTQLNPERTRVVIIDPRQDGQNGANIPRTTIQKLHTQAVELIKIDGKHSRHNYPNGLVLADFFDFG